MTYKSIFKGRLEFGSSKSYDKVLKMYQHRVENYYRSDILLVEEDIFDKENSALDVPRFITQGSEKSWKNTLSLLEYVAQFAVAGNMGAWMTEEGKVLRHGTIEPQSDRVAVQAYIKGRKLSEEEGKEDEALASLNKAIEKYERHAQAYERRGRVNVMLQNYDDAIYDFTKSIDINPTLPETFLGRAGIYMLNKEWKKAIADLEMAIKCSIPLQAIYWKARRLKSDCFLKLGDHAGALNDLKFFTKRKFKEDNPNFQWKGRVMFTYGKSLIELEQYEEAIAVFNDLMEITEGIEPVSDADKFLYRGIARQKANKRGFREDWKKASKLGCKQAATLLKK